MIRSLHIERQSLHTEIDDHLWEFVQDVYLTHVAESMLVGATWRWGIDFVTDNVEVVTILLTSAGFSVRDLGKVSV